MKKRDAYEELAAYENAPPSRKELAYYAFGSAASGLPMGVIAALQFPVFNMILGINPGWIGMVTGAMSLLGAFLDPAFGYIGDRTRTRWGRRRPYIAIGGLVISLTISAYFFASPSWNPYTILAWFVALNILLSLGQAMFGVSHFALGIEMATDYDQRTRVVAWRSVVDKVVGILNSWYFRLSELFTNALFGSRLIAIAAGLLGLVGSMMIVFNVKERKYRAAVAETRRPESFFKAAAFVLGNRTYLRLLFIWVVFSMNMGIFGVLGLYLNVYYVFGGDKAAGATLGGLVGTLGLLTSLAAIPASTWACRVLGKHVTLKYALWLYIAGSALKWWCVNPHYPYLQLILPFFFSVGISSFYMILFSMQADVVDLDELQHGGRREGMFGAMGGWVMKLGVAVAAAISGWVLVWTGFNVELDGNQADGVFFKMRLCFSWFPIIFCLLALVAVRKWPLTRERCEEIQQILLQKRAAAEAAKMSGDAPA